MALLKKNILVAALGAAFVPLAASAATGAWTGDQYTKALWMATRFFGSMRSGEGPNWILQETNYPKSFVKDSYNGKNISGGWFDCGDHVVFGQTQFYSTYILAVALDQFPSGLPDVYAGDYSDYKASKDYSIAGGKANGLKDLLEEIRYNADFLVKITPNPSSFVVQVGDGDLDHQKWVTAGKMASLPKASGGESDGARYTNPPTNGSAINDAYTPGMASAALAIMARRDPDAARRAAYLEHAINAYAYSRAHTGVSSAQSYYNSSYWSGRWQEARFLAALELWRTTGADSFKTQATTEWVGIQHESGSYTRLDYTNAIPIAWLMAMQYLPSLNQKYLVDFLKSYRNSTGNSGVTTWKASNGSFALRSATGAAFLHALYAKFNNDKTYDDFIYKQVDYILGANTTKQSYLVGWDEGGVKKHVVVHHRGYYGNENTAKADAAYSNGAMEDSVPKWNKYLGAILPGATDGTVGTSITDYGNVEVCLEQNAPLVGALAYITSQQKPVDSSMLSAGIVLRRVIQPLDVVRSGRNFEFRAPAGQSLSEVKVLDASGREVWSTSRASSGVRWSAPKSGLYVVQAKAGSDRFSASAVMP